MIASLCLFFKLSSLNPSINSWNYVLGEPGFDPNSGDLQSTNSDTITIQELEYGTQYEFYVQSDCGTDWEGPLLINTPSEFSCIHKINMYDSYGDGWNGGSIDLSVNGIIVLNAGSIDNSGSSVGDSASIEFSAEDGDAVSYTHLRAHET